MTTRVLLAEDHTILREGLRALLDRSTDLEVVAEASNGAEAVALSAQLGPDVVVLDVLMPALNGLEAARRIRAQEGAPVVLFLSMYANEAYVEEAFRAGAAGYLLKDCAADQLVEAIRAVAEPGAPIRPGLANVLHLQDKRGPAEDAPPSPFRLLSSRQREVLQLIAEGKTTREIAKVLGVGVKTGETHRRRVLHKLQLENTAELVRYAIREGLTSTD